MLLKTRKKMFGAALAITKDVTNHNQNHFGTWGAAMPCSARIARVVFWSVATAMILASTAMAQTNASGSLTVSATVKGSMSLVFADNPNVGTTGYCPLTNAGTNTAGLDLGTAAATTGDSLPCVAYVWNAGGGRYDVSSSFDVVVKIANTASANYRLAVAMSSAPPANVTWQMNTLTMSTAPQTLQASNAYGTTTETLHVLVKNSVPAQVLSETIFFTATAN